MSGESCVAGACRAAVPKLECNDDEDCPAGSFCDPADSRCKPEGGAPDSGSAPDATSSPDATGSPDATSSPDAGGSPDAAPLDGGLPCTMDQECGPPAQICLGGACVLGCGNNPALCAANQVCDTGSGRCVDLPMSCTTDPMCGPPARVCEGTQCVPGCGQPGGVQCGGATPVCSATTGRCEPPPPCALDADCAAANPAMICVNQRCTLRCDAGAPCPMGQVCNAADGRCLPGQLALGVDCSLDQQCASGFCLGLNVGMTTFELCSTPCSAGGDCPLDFSCTSVSGMSFCLPERVFGPPAPAFDTAAGGMCTATVNTCQTGWCNTTQSSCIETCSRVSDCAAYGGNCYTYAQTGMAGTSYDHLCFTPTSGAAVGAACTTNAGCRSGVCNRYRGTCAAHCCADSDCAATDSCAVYDLDASTPVKLCVPRSATSGLQPLGAACTQGNECESEVCLPTNPADMNSPRKCSTLCCRENDCTALPAGGACRPFNGPLMGTLVGACLPN